MPSGLDQSPIYYIGLIVAIRAWLAFFYTSISQITGLDNNFLNWLTIFAIGIVPDFPLVANVLLAVFLNGSLIIAFAVLVDRLNPLN